MEPKIIFEDANYLCVNKPSGWHTLRGKTKDQTVEAWLLKKFPSQNQIPDAGILHRLDELTSGALLVTKHADQFEVLREKFSGSEIKKIYWAWVKGRAENRGASVYLRGRYKSSKKVSVFQTGKSQELAKTQWKVLKTTPHHSLLEVEIFGPGRRHQIRATLAQAGWPILGDELYGGPPWTPGFGLHSRSIKWDTKTHTADPPETWPQI